MRVLDFVHLAAETGCDLNALLVHGSRRTETTLHCLGIVKLLLLTILIGLLLISEFVAVSRLPVSFVVASCMLVNNSAEACIWTFDWTVNERKFCNIVFVDHTQNGSFLDAVDLWILQFSLVNRLFLIETVRWNQL